MFGGGCWLKERPGHHQPRDSVLKVESSDCLEGDGLMVGSLPESF